MTQEYKNNVIKFLTNNLEQQTGSNTPQFNVNSPVTNDLYDNIRANFSSSVTYVDFVSTDTYSVIVCNGTLTGQSSKTGALVIVDEDYDIVEFISSYSNGDLIGKLSCLNYDENGFYAIERDTNYYIVEMNDITKKLSNQAHYQAVKKKRIQLTTDYTYSSVLKVQRGDNRYFILANRPNGMVGLELRISNAYTWTAYTTTYTKDADLSLFDKGFQAYWDSNDELHFNIAVSDSGLLMLSKGNTSIMVETRIMSGASNNPYDNFIFYSNTIGYFVTLLHSGNNTLYRLYEVNYSTNSYTLVSEHTGNYSQYNQMWLFKNNNSIYYFRTSYVSTQGFMQKFDLYFGLDTNEVQLGTFNASAGAYSFCYPNVVSEFNMNYVYIQNQNTLFSVDFEWNDNDYNGVAFIDNNSLIPDKAKVNDLNRNLYNLVPYLNRYTATMQIPHDYLNTNLTSATLYSKNNNILVNKILSTSKNIYEEVYINFINQFNIVNGNNVDIVTPMFNSSNAYISKLKINYHDTTSEIKTITNNGITNQKTTLATSFSVAKAIDTIEILSEDETMVYKTINYNFEVGKDYNFSIDLRIE